MEKIQTLKEWIRENFKPICNDVFGEEFFINDTLNKYKEEGNVTEIRLYVYFGKNKDYFFQNFDTFKDLEIYSNLISKYGIFIKGKDKKKDEKYNKIYTDGEGNHYVFVNPNKIKNMEVKIVSLK